MRRSQQRRIIALVALVVTALVAAACGGDDGEGPAVPTSAPGPGPSTSTTTTLDPCDGVRTTATEIGVDEDEITVFVMADADTPLGSDRFEGTVDAVRAWADTVNDGAGLACRNVVVRDWDSRQSPADTADGIAEACEHALAMVGTASIVAIDTTVLATCPDEAGARTGLPDIAQFANELAHQCNATTFAIVARRADCPYVGGPRTTSALVGPYRYLATGVPGLHGIALVPSDPPSSTASRLVDVAAIRAAGIGDDGEFRVSARDRDETYARIVQALSEKQSTFVYGGTGADALIELREAALDAGLTGVDVWMCSLGCYSRDFLDSGGDAVEGTYVALPFLPFEEADTNAQLQAYLDAVGGIDRATVWGALAWAAAVELGEVVEAIVDRDGPDGVTRAAVLEGLAGLDGYDVDGWFGPRSPRGPSACHVVVQVRDGAFVRVHPTTRGTLDCDAQNLIDVVVDPSAVSAG